MTTDEAAATEAKRPATARPLESALLSAAMIARRLPWTDVPARTLGLEVLTPEGLTRHLLAHLRRTRSAEPVRLSTPFGSFLLPLATADAEEQLAAADAAGKLGPAVGLRPDGQRYALSPHVALDREAATVPAAELGALVAQDLDRVIAARRGDGTLEWRAWQGATLRLSRRVVAGAAAAEDTLLSELVSATAAPSDRSRRARAAALERRLSPYLADPDPESLAGRLLASGADGPVAAPAVAHALALVSQAATGTALQALALLAAGVAAGAGEVVAETLHRFPPVAAAVHPVRAPFVWQGVAVDAGTEILCAPGWLPEGGGRPSPWASVSVALCGAPSGCAAAPFAAAVAQEIVAGIAAEAHPAVISPRLAPDRLPDALDPRTLVLALGDLPGRGGDDRVTVGMPTAVPVAAHGYAPASYAALARHSADRLERHARSLEACADHDGWNKDETGERFRVALLGHADRCARAAADVRRAARQLAD
ncbi:hypothetical protein [Streptomyces sp. NPDC091268]|uniref:hypothetical protein n=1 Tax=Streptomyces sp. NPDC091268 TaxID=3365979 RepID=UPI00381D543C